MNVDLTLGYIVQIGTFLTKLAKLMEYKVFARFRMSVIALFRVAVLDGANFFIVLLPAAFTKLTITILKVPTDRVHFQFLFNFLLNYEFIWRGF